MASTGSLFLDFSIILLVAGAVALLFYYLRQPVVLGYLLAGFFLGPFSPGRSFVQDAEVMTFFGELGIVFLLFALGLEFNLRKLRKVGGVAIVAGLLETTFMVALGYWLGQLLGWSAIQSIFLGAIMAISSTTVIVKVLAEMGKKDEEWAQTAFGILIIEDVIAVLLLTALSGVAATGSVSPEAMLALATKLGIFLGAALLLGLLAAPRIVDKLTALRVEEVTVILAVGLGFGMALLAAQLGFSAGLGAFVGGALMAESPRVAKIEHKIHPLRDVFTAIFFVTVGAALDPAALVANWRAILLIAGAVAVGKIVAVSIATFVTGASPGKALRVGMTLAQIGEFAFIIAVLGRDLGATDPALYAIAIGVSALTAFATPYLIRLADPLARAGDRHLPSGIHTFLKTYHTWVGRMRKSDKGSAEWRRIRINLLTAALNATVIVAIFAVGATYARGLLGWLAVSAALTPFAYMWFREVQHVVVDLAHLAVPHRLRGGECTVTERLLRRTFGFVATLVTAVVSVAVGAAFVDNVLVVLGIAGAGILVGSVVLGSSLRKFHDEVERTIDRMTGSDTPVAATREEALHMIDHAHAWGAGAREVRLPHVSGGGGRTIGELRLRELTGASVIAVARRGETITNPGPALRFEANDLVSLVGEDESLTRAEEILLGRDLGVEGGATELRVSEQLAGRALRELALPPGVQVLVLRRRDATLAVSFETTLEDGDILVVSGPEEEILRARNHLDGPQT